jgi:Malectin domain
MITAGQGYPVLVGHPTAEVAEYEAVLSSAHFAGETNSKRFLKFVCDKYFAGIHHISEYEIAIEALGRRSDFDPSQDSIVRVEAHRVRKRLREFYEHEGSKHTLHLVIPQGSYLPQFVPATHIEAEPVAHSIPSEIQAPESPPALSTAPRSFPRVLAILLILLVVTILTTGVVVYVRSHSKTQVHGLATTATPLSQPSSSEVLILAGSSAKNYTDQLGHVWSADRFFDGGEPWQVRYRRILRTDDPQLFLTARQGGEFGYDIPLDSGLYEMRLYFAETFYGNDNSEGGGESSRMFDVTANGAPLLTDFDPLSDAGGSNTADVRVFSGISPTADGKLHLKFKNHWQLKGVAFVNGIQLTRTEDKTMLPIRWVAAGSAVEDQAGRLWLPDQYVQGGRRRELGEVVSGTDDPELYKSERYGNFSYAIPVSAGATYSLTLYFSEHWFGVPNFGGSGTSFVRSRVFDVYCNGLALLQDFDIYKEAGGSLKAVTRTFHGLKPNHQGKLLISFVPNQNYASITALQVVPENKR